MGNGFSNTYFMLDISPNRKIFRYIPLEAPVTIASLPSRIRELTPPKVEDLVLSCVGRAAAILYLF